MAAALDAVFQIVVASAATIAAIAAVGIYRRVDQLIGMVEKHDRALYGVDGVSARRGLVSRVADHEDELEDKRDNEE